MSNEQIRRAFRLIVKLMARSQFIIHHQCCKGSFHTMRDTPHALHAYGCPWVELVNMLDP